ncbi:MAG: arginine--tRNA ligase [Clostridia bacterium]|nr:arginine--tRNA ligase [Clostridia bacterium]
MINFKAKIAETIADVTKINKEELQSYMEIPKDSKNGDYAFPCFRLAKELKKAPPVIASEIKENMKIDSEIIEKVEIVGGYLNFYIHKKLIAQEVLNEIENNENYGKSEIGKGKNIIVEYSSPNIAKPFHIGHLRNTLLGRALYNVYQYLGYHTIGINHLGDYGTQFGKMIEGYKLWGEEYNLEENPIEQLMEIYIRINNLCKEDEQVLENCRENFRLLEEGDKYCVALWNQIKDLSMIEFNRIYNMLGIEFDSLKGEAFYSDKIPEVIDLLEKSGKLEESEGAKIIDLEEKGIHTPCLIQKSNGSSIYASRDLAAILYRARNYDFDKCLYVVAYEQNLHFKQIFEVAKLLGLDEKYTNGLEHISYGMVRLATGKMSTREGTVIKVEELLKEAIQRAKVIITQKNPELEEKEEVAKKVGIGAVIFNDLSGARIKDEIFDWNTILNFQGETGPYIQYTYVRTKSVLEKVNKVPKFKEINLEKIADESSQNIIKLLYHFEETLRQVTNKEEPCILARYLIDLSKAFSNFYNENKIMVDEKELQDARVYLTYSVGKVLKIGAGLLGIQMPNKM